MDSGRNLQNIALIGFMGAGKTSVGKLVAEHLHFEFLDTDELIQSMTGRAIADIFCEGRRTGLPRTGATHRQRTFPPH